VSSLHFEEEFEVYVGVVDVFGDADCPITSGTGNELLCNLVRANAICKRAYETWTQTDHYWRMWSDDLLRVERLSHPLHHPQRVCVLAEHLLARTLRVLVSLKKYGELRFPEFLYRRFLRIWPSINFYVMVSVAMVSWAFPGKWHYLATSLIDACLTSNVSSQSNMNLFPCDVLRMF
jgi:hypothetical protein